MTSWASSLIGFGYFLAISVHVCFSSCSSIWSMRYWRSLFCAVVVAWYCSGGIMVVTSIV